jgi:hypothetical protein
LADLSSAKSAMQGGVVQRTNKKQALAWQGYPIYLLSIGISDDPFLEQFSKGQRHKILGAFVSALREGRFSTKKSTMIRSDSIQAALDCISQTFKLADKPDPRLNNNGNIAFFLQRQLQGYKSLDPGETPQVAVTGSILQQFFKQSISPVDIALCELFIGAFFLAMRSCESLQVSGQRKTKILALHNIIFFLGNRVISHGSPPFPFIKPIQLPLFSTSKRRIQRMISSPITKRTTNYFARRKFGQRL